LLTRPRISELYGVWLDVGWLFVVVGATNLAFARAEKRAQIEARAKAEMERVLARREKALREQIREEIVSERLLHSLN
jgi:hypothetical protein